LSLSGTRAITEASAGLKTSNVLPDAAGTHLPPIKFNFGRFSQLATRELIPGVARLDGLWPFHWLPLARLLSAGVLMRRCEVVVVFIGLELDTFSSRIYDSSSRGFVQRKTRIQCIRTPANLAKPWTSR
jgi:hypothetical protein